MMHITNSKDVRRTTTGMSDEQLATIGYIAILWNGIEQNLIGCIWAAADWPLEIANMVTADLGNVSRADLFMNLVQRDMDDSRIKEQTGLTLQIFDKLRTARNDVVHGFYNWSYRSSQTKDTLLKFTAKKRTGSVETKVVNVSQPTLDELAADLHLCAESLNDLLNKIRFRNRFLAGERGVFAQNYEDAVHGWRAPSFDTALLQECLKRRSQPPQPPQNPPPPRSSRA